MEAEKYKVKIEANMTAEQIAEANRKAKEWLDNNADS